MTDIGKFINHVPLFSGLTRRQIRQLTSRFATRSYRPGEQIVTQGQMGAGMYIIVSGEAEVIRTRSDNRQVTVNTFETTDFFGELALLAKGARTASVVAKTEVQCLVLLRSDFLKLLEEDAHMGVVVAQSLAERFRSALDAL